MPVSPAGEQFALSHGRYAAIVTQVGATLRSLRADGEDLVRGFAADEMMPVYQGAVLAPWPNRIGDGRYEFGAQSHQLPVNEPERHNALHGLVCWQHWDITRQAPDAITLTTRLWPRPGYPFLLDLAVSYALGDDGLRIELSALNQGEREAPYGCSIHPYLVAGPGRVDDWRLLLPAAEFLDVDPERLLPRGRRPVAGSDVDFRRAREVSGTRIDHAFTGIDRDARGEASATVVGPDGRSVAISWDRRCPWVQVHTADHDAPELHRTGLAIEPMTCPPDAFRSGTDLIRLAPGDTHAAAWRIAASTPPP